MQDADLAVTLAAMQARLQHLVDLASLCRYAVLGEQLSP